MASKNQIMAEVSDSESSDSLEELPSGRHLKTREATGAKKIVHKKKDVHISQTTIHAGAMGMAGCTIKGGTAVNVNHYYSKREDLVETIEKQGDLNGCVSQEVRRHVARKIGKDWKKLGWELDLDDSDLDHVEHKGRNDLQVLGDELLKAWARRDRQLATKEKLANALTAIERADIGEKILNM